MGARHLPDGKQTNDLHIIFKNKYSDFPVKNARQLSQMLKRKP